jgi:hypothetical protein
MDDHAQGHTNLLTWSELEHVAEEAFRVWTTGGDLAWARYAWDVLTRAGLANFRTEQDRCKVAIRFLALAGFYLEFCETAFEERIEPDYTGWAPELNVSPFRIGQLFSSAEVEEDDELAVESALEHLVDEARAEVVGALVRGFGGRSGLFVAMWRTAAAEEDDEADAESDEEILNAVTFNKLAAVEFLETESTSLAGDGPSAVESAQGGTDERAHQSIVTQAEYEEVRQRLRERFSRPLAYPALRDIADATGDLKSPFDRWRDQIGPLDPKSSVPMWWPWAVEGRRLTPEQRWAHFVENLEAVYTEEQRAGQATASDAGLDDIENPSARAPGRRWCAARRARRCRGSA